MRETVNSSEALRLRAYAAKMETYNEDDPERPENVSADQYWADYDAYVAAHPEEMSALPENVYTEYPE